MWHIPLVVVSRFFTCVYLYTIFFFFLVMQMVVLETHGSFNRVLFYTSYMNKYVNYHCICHLMSSNWGLPSCYRFLALETPDMHQGPCYGNCGKIQHEVFVSFFDNLCDVDSFWNWCTKFAYFVQLCFALTLYVPLRL